MGSQSLVLKMVNGIYFGLFCAKKRYEAQDVVGEIIGQLKV